MENNTNTPGGGAPVQAPAQSAAPVAPQVPTQSAQAAPAQTPPVNPAVGQGLPEGVSERTAERFQKLTENNQRLADANKLLQEELIRKRQLEQQFSPFQQPQQPQTPAVEQFVTTDPVTGDRYVDEQKLQKALVDARERATRAEQSVQTYIRQQRQQEEVRQTEDAYKAYPELNPQTEKFDVELNRRTRAFLFDSMMNPVDYGGRALTFREAADRARGQVVQPTQPVAQPQQPTNPAMENKTQAALDAQGVSSTSQPVVNPNEDLNSLRMKTRRGGPDGIWATAQRLSKILHTGTPKSPEASGNQ